MTTWSVRGTIAGERAIRLMQTSRNSRPAHGPISRIDSGRGAAPCKSDVLQRDGEHPNSQFGPFIVGNLVVRDLAMPFLEGDTHLESGEVRPYTSVRAHSERKVPVR